MKVLAATSPDKGMAKDSPIMVNNDSRNLLILRGFLHVLVVFCELFNFGTRKSDCHILYFCGGERQNFFNLVLKLLPVSKN